MPNLRQIFLVKLFIFTLGTFQSFHCQANKQTLQKADSLFNTKNYQEALVIYKDILHKDRAYSPSMLLKMAFISEGIGDFPSTTVYLSKYYDLKPNPQITAKIKELTNQDVLTGYAVTDQQRLFGILTDYRQLIVSGLALFLVFSLIGLVMRGPSKELIATNLILIVLVFVSNNYLDKAETGIVTGNPSLIMSQPTAAGDLVRQVGPGHRVIIESSVDIWYKIKWNDQTAYVKMDQISKI